MHVCSFLEANRKNGYVRTNMYVAVHILNIARFKEDWRHAYDTTKESEYGVQVECSTPNWSELES